MRVRTFPSARSFLERAGPWLERDEAVNNLVLGIALSVADREEHPVVGQADGDPAAWFAAVEDQGAVTGVAFRTPPHLLGVTQLPRGAAALVARAAMQAFDRIPGVVGEPVAAEAVAQAWALSTGDLITPSTRMRIMRLDRLRPPAEAPDGDLRPVRDDEAEFFTSWLEAFERDTGVFSYGARRTVERLISERALFAWEGPDGPASMGGMSGATPRGLRVGYIYTPPEERGRGYATAITAALSQRILSAGWEFSVLYVDENDPVANHIYTGLGYEPVARSGVFLLDPAPPT